MKPKGTGITMMMSTSFFWGLAEYNEKGFMRSM